MWKENARGKVMCMKKDIGGGSLSGKRTLGEGHGQERGPCGKVMVRKEDHGGGGSWSGKRTMGEGHGQERQ